MTRTIELFTKDHGQAVDAFLNRLVWILLAGLVCFVLGAWWEENRQTRMRADAGHLPDILNGVESLPDGTDPDLKSDLVGWIQNEMDSRSKKRGVPITLLCLIAAMVLLLGCGGLEAIRREQRATEKYADFLLDRDANHLERAINSSTDFMQLGEECSTPEREDYTSEDARMNELLIWSSRSSSSSSAATKLEALRVLLCEIARRELLPVSERLSLSNTIEKAIRSGEPIRQYFELLHSTLDCTLGKRGKSITA